MRKVIGVLALSLVFVLSGCAGTLTTEKMQAYTAGFVLPKLPEEGKGVVYVVRPLKIGGLIRFNVYIDDKKKESEMGYTRGEQYIYFNVTPGTHRVLSKAENWAEQHIEVKVGDVIFLEQLPKFGMLIARNNLRAVNPIAGKYWVKRLPLGTIKRSDREVASSK